MYSRNLTRTIDLLLVEDNPGDVRLTQEALREAPFQVKLSVAKDGVEAVDFLHRRGKYWNAPRPDLILLDLNLPLMNGPEVLSDIKTDPDLKRIPVLVMTSSREPGDIQKAYSLNANSFITKPVHLEDFMSMVQSIENFWLHTAELPDC